MAATATASVQMESAVVSQATQGQTARRVSTSHDLHVFIVQSVP